MTQRTLPDFSGVYSDLEALIDRAREAGLTVSYGCRLFDRQVVHIEGDGWKGVYLMEHLPGGRVYLTDKHIGRNALRFVKEIGAVCSEGVR